MTLMELAEKLGADIAIEYDRRGPRHGFVCHLRCVSIDIGERWPIMLKRGRGQSPNEAAERYVKNIRGQRIIVNGTPQCKGARRAFTVPRDLIAGWGSGKE